MSLTLHDLANKFCPDFGPYTDSHSFWRDAFIRDMRTLIEAKCNEQKTICYSMVAPNKIQTEVKNDILNAPYPSI